MCSAPPQGWLMVDGCTDHHILHGIFFVCPQLSRHVLEKCLFMFFIKREQRCLAPPAATATLVFCPGGIDCTSCFEENASS